jgi:hypothetical protein
MKDEVEDKVPAKTRVAQNNARMVEKMLVYVVEGVSNPTGSSAGLCNAKLNNTKRTPSYTKSKPYIM